MAVHIQGLFEESLNEKIKNSYILVVGAGGIGCELLKSLVLSGFEKLYVIDLDTIELSNLNRQFLFHKQHIGRSKAVVAKESVQKFNPKANITADHDSITNTKYDCEFFKQFTAVANALDNLAARTHVNRMCLAADIPLIESGTSGYLGQVTVYKKKVTECFECLPRSQPKTYPGCTIRNTPSEPVHCIVWAKNLFNQLFGETDADEEVSPDLTDPELRLSENENEVGNVNRINTRAWARASNFDPEVIFNKLFSEDIKYLNTMTDLWETRKRPVPLQVDSLIDGVPGSSKQEESTIKDQAVWSVKQCYEVFSSSLTTLKKTADDTLLWDKDTETHLDFVVACANLRASCFNIKLQSKFDTKAIAGNIIPAIATTNAVISGLLVLQLINVLKGDFSKCRTSFLKATAFRGQNMISSAQLEKPKPNCIVCSDNNLVEIKLNLNTFSVATLEKVLKEKLHLVQPDVMLRQDDSAIILISSDPEDDQDFGDKTLADLKIQSGSRLLCEDFFQQYQVILVLEHNNKLKDQEFEMETDVDALKSQQKQNTVTEETSQTDAADFCEAVDDDILVCEQPGISVSPTKHTVVENEITALKPVSIVSPTKHKAADDESRELPPAKRARTSTD